MVLSGVNAISGILFPPGPVGFPPAVPLGGWGVNHTFPTALLVNTFKFKSILYLFKVDLLFLYL